MSSRILCCASEGFCNIRIPTKLGRTELLESNPGKAAEIMMLSMESRRNSSGTFSQDSQRCSSVIKCNDLLSDLGQTPETFTGKILCQCSMTSPVTERKATKMNAWQMPESSKYLREDLVLDNGHLLVHVLQRSGIVQRLVPQRAWDNIAEEMLLEFAECGHPTFRATTPLSRGVLKRKGHGKLSIHFAADELTIETILRIILSVNQLSIYGAVAAICEEFENHQDGSGEPEILMGQSIVLGESKAEIPLQNENPLNHQILWQQCMERIESISPESKVSSFFKEAGFILVVEVGQYFMTKDTGDFRQFRSVACREYPRRSSFTSKRMVSTKHENCACIGSHDQFSTLQKYGIEIRIWSVKQDNSQSWVRISYGTIKRGRFKSRQYRNSCRSRRRSSTTNKHQGCCSQIKGKSKTSTERTWWYNYHTDARKKMDWLWAIRTNSRCVRSLEESDQSSSTQSNSTAGRRWSNSILRN